MTTQIPFELPEGANWLPNQCSKLGHMRLATGADEMLGQQAAELMDNTAYGILVRLARVSAFENYPSPTPDDVGALFMPDLNYLIELYNDINPPDYELSAIGGVRLGETWAIP